MHSKKSPEFQDRVRVVIRGTLSVPTLMGCPDVSVALLGEVEGSCALSGEGGGRGWGRDKVKRLGKKVMAFLVFFPWTIQHTDIACTNPLNSRRATGHSTLWPRLRTR